MFMTNWLQKTKQSWQTFRNDEKFYLSKINEI